MKISMKLNSNPLTTPQFSTKLADYKFVKLIGGGSYGNVYEALDILTGRHVAIKALEIYYALEEFAVYDELFGDRSEWISTTPCCGKSKEDVMSQFPVLPIIESNSSSFFPMCYGIITDKEFVPEPSTQICLDLKNLNKRRRPEIVNMRRDSYLILELCDGTLKDFGFWDSDVGNYVRMIGSALQHAHVRGIIYGDFNPSNILFKRQFDGSVKWMLSDFGFAMKISGMSQVVSRKQVAGSSLPFHDNAKKNIKFEPMIAGKILDCGTRVARSPETYKYGKNLKGVPVEQWKKIDVWGMATALCQEVTEKAICWTCYAEKSGKNFGQIKYMVEFFGMDFITEHDADIMKDSLINIGYFDKMLKNLTQEMIDLSITIHTRDKPNMRKLFHRCLVVDLEKRASVEELLEMVFDNC